MTPKEKIQELITLLEQGNIYTYNWIIEELKEILNTL